MLRSLLSQQQAASALRRWVAGPFSTVDRLAFSTAAAAPHGGGIKIPPNLTFDPRCSFAPQAKRNPIHRRSPVAAPANSLEDGENEDKDREELDPDTVEEEFDAEEEESYDGVEEELYIQAPETLYAKPLPERLNVEVHTLFAPEHSTLTGTLHLDASVFGCDPIRVDFLKRAVNYYRARKRGRRKAKTKTISEVSGSGRKVRQQKGTGRARAGHSRPPHWRGGAKAHGPKNTTDYSKTKLNKKVRKAATRHVLSQKLKENNLLVLNQVHELSTHKTGQLVRLFDPWDIGGEKGSSALLLDHYYPAEEDGMPKAFEGVPANAHVASRNIPRLNIANTDAANVWEILKYEKLILTLSAIEHLEKRLAIEL